MREMIGEFRQIQNLTCLYRLIWLPKLPGEQCLALAKQLDLLTASKSEQTAKICATLNELW